MHVVMLSDGEGRGGAAIAATRLAEALLKEGVQVSLIVGEPNGEKHLWNTYPLKTRLGEKVILRTFGILSESLRGLFQRQLLSPRLSRLLKKLSPDVINIHNLHGANWEFNLVEVCIRHAPLVWTLHDMWSSTGYCSYNYDCTKFITGCDAPCPQGDKYFRRNSRYISRAWRERKKFFTTHPEVIGVSPSHWLKEKMTQGLWGGHLVEVIPYGLPLEVYKPVERNIARKALGINEPPPILLTGAQYLDDPRKGGKILVEALEKISTRPFTLVTFGHRTLSLKAKDVRLYQLGYIHSHRIKSLLYNAADLFIHPALIDNFPNVILEAIACGTPVVGFATGGVPEIVRPGKTGWLAKEVSVKDLVTTLENALNDLHRGVDLREECRFIAETEYNLKLQAQRYLSLFKKISKNKK